MTVTHYLLLAALAPLLAWAILLFGGRRIGRYSAPLATALACASFALSVGALVLFVSKWSDKPEGNQTPYVEAFTYRWIVFPAAAEHHMAGAAAAVGIPADSALLAPAQPAALTLGIVVDSLSVTFFLLVSFLAVLVHVFSLGAMAGDPRSPRFFAWLNFLGFAMFALLLANSIPQFFMAWQLVGIAGYFLVAHHQAQRGPVLASLRTFVINRIGDAAFLIAIGILMIYTGGSATGSPHFPGLAFFDAQGTSVLTDSIRDALGVRSSEFLYFTGSGFLDLHWLTWACIGFIIAALTRAAQFPFFVGLDQSVHAPAPAWAMLQSCTTAASGIILLARIYPILTLDARMILAIVGCTSLFLAALVACVQYDLRKILAWTTISQLGYVLLFLGAGGYMAGLLHLFTHAFFKAGLLLAAATVVQSMQQTDLRQTGGLWKRLPITAAASLVAVLAMAGTPWLSGAYSANLGLARVYDFATALRGTTPATSALSAFLAWAHPQSQPAGIGAVAGTGGGSETMLLLWIPVITSYLTAFAVGRWWCRIFIAPPRDPKLLEEVHESALGTLPLIILAGFSVGFWFEFFGILQFINQSLPPGTPITPAVADAHLDSAFQAVAPVTALSVGGVLVAILLYFRGSDLAGRFRRLPGINVLHFYLVEKLFLETFYEGVILNGVLLLSRCVMIVDRYVLSAALRVLAFLGEALAHLMVRIDVVLDRPGRIVALLLAPRLLRLLPAAPPPPTSSEAAGTGPKSPVA